MIGIALIALKYLTSLMTVAVTVAGAWFFDFTRADKDTGKKTLTHWGRHAILIVGVSLCLAAITTVWSDLDSAWKKADSDERAKEEKALANSERLAAAKSRTALEEQLSRLRQDTKTLLDFIKARFDDLSDSAKQEAAQVVRGLNSIEDLQREYPDLYKRLQEVRSFTEAGPIISQALERQVSKRISARAECSRLPLESLAQPGDPIQVVNKAIYIHMGTGSLISIMIAPEGLRLSFGFGKPINSIAFQFGEGAMSDRLSCGQSQYFCSLWTQKGEFPSSIYKLLQQKEVVSIETGADSYKLSPENGTLLRLVFSCLTP